MENHVMQKTVIRGDLKGKAVTSFNPKPGQAQELATGLRRILAPNPSPMTFRGTNTYLLGTRDIAIIDPGPPDDAHFAAIMDALEAHQRISHVFVTHSHIDHSPLAMVLAQMTGTRVHAFGGSKAGRAPVMAGLADLGGGEGIDETFLPDVTMIDGEEIAGSDWTLTALHTPGHMGNHLCFGWAEGNALFSGDLVMGWATSMVSPPDGSLADFRASLTRIHARAETIYYPGHGAPVEQPHARIKALLDHRQMREDQILAALRDNPADPATLTARIYTDTDPALLPAAQRNVLAHLIDLVARDMVQSDSPSGIGSTFRAA